MTDEERRDEESRDAAPAQATPPPGPSGDSSGGANPSEATPFGEGASRPGEPPRGEAPDSAESTGLDELHQVSARQARASGPQRPVGGAAGDAPSGSTPGASTHGRGAPADGASAGGALTGGALEDGRARKILLGVVVLSLAVMAAIGGYVANLVLGGPNSAAGESAAAEGGTQGNGAQDDPTEAAGTGPFGNPAGLSYTRLSGTDFLVVRDGAAVATLSPLSAQSSDIGVAVEFTAEYHPADGQYTVRAEDFFHYAHQGGAVPEAGTDDLGIIPEAEELAVLTPDEPEQEFTVELPGAPFTGVLTYDAAEELDLGLSYRTPLCYLVDGDFSSQREDCEAVPGPGF